MAGALAVAGGYGVDAVRVALNSASYSDSVSSGTASANFRLDPSGQATGTNGTAYSWRLLGSSAEFQVMASVSSGTLTSGVTGTWLGLQFIQEWIVERSSGGSKTATLNIQIRDASTLAVLATATVTLTATRG